MSQGRSPSSLFHDIPNIEARVRLVQNARQWVVDLSRSHRGKWVNVDHYDLFRDSDRQDKLAVQSRRIMWNPCGRFEVARNKDQSGKGTVQQILLADGGYLYIEKDRQKRKVVQWKATDDVPPPTSQENPRRLKENGYILKRKLREHDERILSQRNNIDGTPEFKQWWADDGAEHTNSHAASTLRTPSSSSSSSSLFSSSRGRSSTRNGRTRTSSNKKRNQSELKNEHETEKDALANLAKAAKSSPNRLIKTGMIRGNMSTLPPNSRRRDQLVTLAADSIGNVLSIIDTSNDPEALSDLLRSALAELDSRGRNNTKRRKIGGRARSSPPDFFRRRITLTDMEEIDFRNFIETNIYDHSERVRLVSKLTVHETLRTRRKLNSVLKILVKTMSDELEERGGNADDIAKQILLLKKQGQISERQMWRGKKHAKYPGAGKPLPPTLTIVRVQVSEAKILQMMSNAQPWIRFSSWGCKMHVDSQGEKHMVGHMIRDSSCLELAQKINKNIIDSENDAISDTQLLNDQLTAQGGVEADDSDVQPLPAPSSATSSSSSSTDSTNCQRRHRHGRNCILKKGHKGRHCFRHKSWPSIAFISKMIKQLTTGQKKSLAAQSNHSCKAREGFATLRIDVGDAVKLLKEIMAARQTRLENSGVDILIPPPSGAFVRVPFNTLKGETFAEQGKLLIVRLTMLEAYMKKDFPDNLKVQHPCPLLCMTYLLNGATENNGGSALNVHEWEMKCDGHSHGDDGTSSFHSPEAQEAKEWWRLPSDVIEFVEWCELQYQADLSYEMSIDPPPPPPPPQLPPVPEVPAPEVLAPSPNVEKISETCWKLKVEYLKFTSNSKKLGCVIDINESGIFAKSVHSCIVDGLQTGDKMVTINGAVVTNQAGILGVLAEITTDFFIVIQREPVVLSPPLPPPPPPPLVPTSAIQIKCMTILDRATGIVERSDNALKIIDLYRGHLVKSKWEKIQNIKEAKELGSHQCILTIDWKMKLKTCAYRQSQSAWYAQRGLSLHGAMLLMRAAPGVEAHHTQSGKKLEDGDLQMYFIDILSDDTTQDAQAVLCCLDHTLKAIKEMFPHLTEVIVRADGAGCYKSKTTRLGAMFLHL